MIAKLTKGAGFGGLVSYVLGDGKNPKMLAEAKQCWGDSASELALELTTVAKFRPTTKLPVRHFSIAFAPEDGEIDNDIKSEIAVRIMEEMGYEDCQYFAVTHDRDDDNHHHAHTHDHMHIVANAITPHGERISDSKDYYRMEKCLREIEKDYNFRQVENSWEQVKRLKQTPEPSELQDKIDKALADSHNFREWIEKLEAKGINVRFKITSRGTVQGISYIYQGELKKGGDVDRSWRSLSARFGQTPENLELMRSANVKTQSLSIELRRTDRELLIKAADLAIQKMDGKNKFDDKSVKITMVDGVLKVLRLRPTKIILSAKKDDNGEWKSIGVPDIDPKKDLQILESVKKTEHKMDRDVKDNKDSSDTPDVNTSRNRQIAEKVAQIAQADETARQQLQKIKPRNRSKELE